MLYSIQGW